MPYPRACSFGDKGEWAAGTHRHLLQKATSSRWRNIINLPRTEKYKHTKKKTLRKIEIERNFFHLIKNNNKNI